MSVVNSADPDQTMHSVSSDLGLDNVFRLNNAPTHEGHLCQNRILTWFGSETDVK